jgi:hypothetical protein
MALKSRLGTAIFNDGENSLALRASLANLNALGDDVGMDFLTYMMGGNCSTPAQFAKLFYHLQARSDGSEETEDAIYEAFFCDIAHMADPAFQDELKRVFIVLLGDDLQKKLNEASKPSTKKKGVAA